MTSYDCMSRLVYKPEFLNFSQTHLCSFYGESESCLDWAGGHLSSPSVVGCPSEQDVRSSEKKVAP